MTDRAPICLGIWQDETPTGGVDAVLARIAEALHEAKSAGVNLLVFPECFLTGYYRVAEDVPLAADAVTPEVMTKLDALADDTRIAFVLGSYEPRADGVRNAAHVFLPNASHGTTYCKRALYGEWEKEAFTQGKSPCLFEYMGYRFGVLICFDVEFPELVREAAKAGADAVLVPTALMEPDHWIADFVVQSRAVENGITVVYANRIGREGHLTFLGKSQICDPLAQSREVAPEGHCGLIHAPLAQPELPADYIAEIAEQRLPSI